MNIRRLTTSLVPRTLVNDARRMRHGETSVQQNLANATRTMSARLGLARGDGSTLFGPPLRPRRAEIVQSFDSWQIMDDLAAALATALGTVEFVRLPRKTKTMPTLVVAAPDGPTVLDLLRRHEAAHTWWVAAEIDGLLRVPRPVTEPFRLSGDEAALIFFRYLMSPGGELLGDERIGVRLELWAPTVAEQERWPDGGTWPVGTLLASSTNRVTIAIEPGQWRDSQSTDGNLLSGSELPHVLDVSEPIDVVYTWVDGNDPAWQERKRAAQNLGRHTRFTGDALNSSRFDSHDELRYSLRSIEMFAGWVRHIWLVTDRQVPRWLREEHPRLTVVDHREIFADPAALPVFNSHAIESQLHHIEGMADKYLYLNDDVFFGRPVQPESFFYGNGIMKLFPSYVVVDQGPRQASDIASTSAAKRNRELIESAFSRTFTNKTRHTPIPQSRSVLYEMEDRFPHVFDSVMRSRFRSPDDYSIPSSLAQYYAYATGRAVTGGIRYGYANLAAPNVELRLKGWLRHRRHQCFCLNDTGEGLDGAKSRASDLATFLGRYFPVPSSFEQPEH